MKLRVHARMKVRMQALRVDPSRCTENRLNNLLYFVYPEDIAQPLGSTVNAQFNQSALYGAHYSNGDCLKGDFSDLTFKILTTFVPEFHPWEVYTLQASLALKGGGARSRAQPSIMSRHMLLALFVSCSA